MDHKIIKQQQKELRMILNEWNFLAVAIAGPQDEYDCMLGPLLTLLHNGADENEVRDFIKKERKEHFGLPEESPSLEPTLQKIFTWWKKYK